MYVINSGIFRILTEESSCQTFPNVALYKNVYQSTSSYGGVPERAVDGDKNPSFSAGSCTHTSKNLPEQWWYVDLGSQYTICGVTIVNRNKAGEAKTFAMLICVPLFLDMYYCYVNICEIYVTHISGCDTKIVWHAIIYVP